MNFRQLAFYLGPTLGLLLGVSLKSMGLEFDTAFTAGVTFWVATWWMFEPVPIPATSLIPMFAFPLFGVLEQADVGAAYGNKLILLLMGGFILSTAMERSGAHRRLALNMVHLFGADSPRRLVFGFMAASAFLSMWISNTATTLMLLPVVLAVIASAENQPKLAVALLLGLAYSASIGGMGTPIGTPPNIAFMSAYEDATGKQISFMRWMSLAIPIATIMLIATGWWLTRRLPAKAAVQLPSVGDWQTIERRVLAVFGLTAIAWMTRNGPLGGWSTWFNLPNANDAIVALAAVVAMFLIPDGRGGRLLDWPTAAKIPWGILLLYAGGLCIASAFKASGLSLILGEGLGGLSHLPLIALIAAVCLLVTFLTELTSNTATTVLLMPILAAAAAGANMDPAWLMLPATLTASCAFMLPVATAPNAIVFGTGKLTVALMARTGLILNLIGVMVVATASLLMF